MLIKIVSSAVKFFRRFRVRKYESVSPMALIKFIFFWAFLGCIYFFDFVVFGDDWKGYFGISSILLSILLCVLLPCRISFLMLFCVPLFIFIYLSILYWVARFSFLFIWS